MEFRCSEAEFEAMKARDALYAEAEAVNEEFHSILERIYREGAPAEMPEDLKAITAGSARSDGEEWLAGLRENEFTMVGGEMRQVWVKRNLASREGSEISLSECTDASSAMVYLRNEPIAPGDVGIQHLYFRHVDGKLVIVAVDAEDVATCD